MKLSILVAATIFPFVLLALGCIPDSAQGSSPADSVEARVVEEEEPVIPGTIISDRSWFRESISGPATRKLDVGEKVSIIGEKQPDPEDTDNLYVPIRLADGSEGWMIEWFAIPDTVPGVLTQDAKIYSEPKLSKLTPQPDLVAMSIVAVGLEGDVNGFLRVSYVNAGNYAMLNRYVKTDLISQDEKDVLAAYLYSLAMDAEEESIRAEFLDSASEIRSPAFGMFIDQEVNGVVEAIPNDLTVTTMIVMLDGITAHESPDSSTLVLGTYNRNDILGVRGRSTTKRTENDVEDWWYELDDGSWIFGAYVQVN